jgi:hypothetical protein
MREPYYTLNVTSEFGNYHETAASQTVFGLLEDGFDTELFPNPFVRLGYLCQAYFLAAQSNEWLYAAIAAVQCRNLYERTWSESALYTQWTDRGRVALSLAAISITGAAEMAI